MFITNVFTGAWKLLGKIVWTTTLFTAGVQSPIVAAPEETGGRQSDICLLPSYFNIEQQICSLPSAVAKKNYNKKFCQLPEDTYPINRVPNAKYSVINKAGRKLLAADKPLDKQQYQEMAKQISYNLEIASKMQAGIEKGIKKILGEDINDMLPEEGVILNVLSRIVGSTAVQIKMQKAGMCGQTVNYSLGRIIMSAVKEGKKIPTLVGIEASFDFDRENDPSHTEKTGQHLLSQHVSLLVVDDVNEETKDFLKQFQALLQESENQKGLVAHNHKQLVDLLHQMGLAVDVCDAWDNLQGKFQENINVPESFFNYIYNSPEKIQKFQVITAEDLELPLVKKVIDNFFLTQDICQMWLDKESCSHLPKLRK